ncbi:MAG: hypothetical protein GX096_01530 [Clostridiales bacterium]|nr:hypothetical protein [Clostridiales bacterium]
MKKLLAMLIILCLLMPLCAIAEKSVFSLRSGYYWGMTPDEVTQLAQEEDLVSVPVKSGQLYQNAVVGGYSTELLFGHEEDGLDSIRYRFMPIDSQWDSEANTQMYDDLLRGLTMTYGEPTEARKRINYSVLEWNLESLDTGLLLVLYNEDYERARGYYCLITYSHDPEPTPTPTPTASPTPVPTLLPNDGF